MTGKPPDATTTPVRVIVVLNPSESMILRAEPSVPGTTWTPSMTLVFSKAALVKFIVTGMVNVDPAARRPVGRSEYWKMCRLVDVPLMLIAFVPTVQISCTTEVWPVITLPNDTGLGLHAREGTDTVTGAPMARTSLSSEL
jgi:hypothetical protein